jgi:hypothetical protein
MFVEVALSQPYNEGCDVYSFSLLLWEMLSLKIPYSGHTLESLRDNVWQGKQERPKLDESWSKNIKELLESSWTPNVGARWEMDQVKNTLKLECVKSRGGNSAGLEHIQRRSTFVFKPWPSSKDLISRPAQKLPPEVDGLTVFRNPYQLSGEPPSKILRLSRCLTRPYRVQ